MQIIELKPNGYCNGVISALKKCLEAIKKYQGQKIYLLGMIIHNNIVCNSLKEKGIIILDGKTKLELIDQIDNGVVIISAHGVASKVILKAQKKGLIVVDATCPKVQYVHQKIKKALDDGYTALYIGNKNHPEAQGVCDEDARIILISALEDLKKLPKEKKYYISNQTTMSVEELAKYHQYIKENFSKAIIENQICLATTKRQKALYDLTGDLLIVIGGKESSNTRKLYETAIEKAHFKTILKIESVADLKEFNFAEYETIYITSGASTPHLITKEVIKYLKKEQFSSSYDLNLLLS